MMLFTKAVTKALREAHYKNTTPVVKIFNPTGSQTWLLTYMEPHNEGEHTVCWGYCDIGQGCVEYGTVYKEELETITGMFRMHMERDLHWKPIPGMDYDDLLSRQSMADGPY